MSDTSASAGGGIGFTGSLTIVFIVLKLLDKIDWSWGWILSPIWISLIIFVIIVSFMLWASK